MADYSYLLNRIKIYLGYSGDGSGGENSSHDAILSLMLEDAANAVMSYCHVKKLGGALDSVVTGLVLRRFKEDSEGLLSSLKMGDVSFSYQAPITSDTFTDSDRAILNAYRRVILR